MKKSLSILIVFISIFTLSQKIVELNEVEIKNELYYFKNSNELFAGKIIEKYANGKTEVETIIEEGQLISIKMYYESGEISMLITVDDNRISAKRISYNINGKIEFEENITLDGKKNGATRSYHENGGIRREVYYKNGLLDGIGRNFYDNGKILIESEYENGKEKTLKKYYENGKLEIDAYVNEDETTFTKLYYENGKLKSEEKQKDKEIIEGKYYDAKGKLEKTVP